MLSRGGGSACSTAKYQNRIWSSSGTLRMTSMYTVASLATSQLDDRRARPIAKPRMVARTMPMTATRIVLSRPTQNTRQLGESSL